ncbi:unnamed protein product, partial [Urochloa humidicola]
IRTPSPTTAAAAAATPSPTTDANAASSSPRAPSPTTNAAATATATSSSVRLLDLRSLPLPVHRQRDLRSHPTTPTSDADLSSWQEPWDLLPSPCLTGQERGG